MFKIILEMANNHMGSTSHAKTIISSFSEVIKKVELDAEYYVKFQYRDLDTYIREELKGKTDIHFVKRFETTRLTDTQFKEIGDYARARGFKLACTPFDSVSARKVISQNYDMIKIASACIDDWQIHETIIQELSKLDKKDFEITFSTGGASLEQIDRLASFYNHRFTGPLNILHCVAEYPYSTNHANLAKIKRLAERFPNSSIGYSSHETPDELDLGAWAVIFGASVLEKHVGVDTDKIENNQYTIRPQEFELWLKKIQKSVFSMGAANQVSETELKTVHSLKRGAVFKKAFKAGSDIVETDVMFVFPRDENQLGPEHFGMFQPKYRLKQDVISGQNLSLSMFEISSAPGDKANRQTIAEYVHSVKGLLREAGISYQINAKDVELSHHYGVDKLRHFGALLISRINNELYSKKIVAMVAGQCHPAHKHAMKDETFEVLWGHLRLIIDESQTIDLAPGDTYRIHPNTLHSFSTNTGVVFEEIATEATPGDSEYMKQNDKNRKSKLDDFWALF